METELTPMEIVEMDITLLLGQPSVHAMRSTLTQEEFYKWVRYLQLHPLYGERIQLAQMAMMLSAFMGSKDSKFEDFYTNKHPEPEKPQETVSKQQQDQNLDQYIRSVYT